MKVLLSFLLLVLLFLAPVSSGATSLVVEEVSIEQPTATTSLLRCTLTLLDPGDLRAIEVRVAPEADNADATMALFPEAPEGDVRVLPPKQLGEEQLFAMVFPMEGGSADLMAIGAFECESPSAAPVQPAFSAFVVRATEQLEEIPVSYVELQPGDSPAGGMFSVFPNPAGRSVEIRYVMPATGQVDLAVYDPSGRRVRTLIAGSQVAGEHVTTWKGRDESGRQLPAGVYFSLLGIGSETWTRKVTLLPAEGGSP